MLCNVNSRIINPIKPIVEIKDYWYLFWQLRINIKIYYVRRITHTGCIKRNVYCTLRIQYKTFKHQSVKSKLIIINIHNLQFCQQPSITIDQVCNETGEILGTRRLEKILKRNKIKETRRLYLLTSFY